MLAKNLAESEYEKYRLVEDRNYVSDFEKEVKRIEDVLDERRNRAPK